MASPLLYISIVAWGSRASHPVTEILLPPNTGSVSDLCADTSPATQLRKTIIEVLHVEFLIKLALEFLNHRNEVLAGLFEHVAGRDGAVGLDFDDEVGFEWVGNFVACEEDCGILE